MAKKSFTFRIDDDNLRFLRQVQDGGDNMSLVVNQSIRTFRNSVQNAARLSYCFVPSILFDNNNK